VKEADMGNGGKSSRQNVFDELKNYRVVEVHE
jgi:hypothetical protein